jgi:two-component sensor histidine kinase
VSPHMAAITGITPGAAGAEVGEALYRHAHPDDREGVRTAVYGAIRKSGRAECRFRLIRADLAEPLWLEASFLAARGADAEVTDIVGVVKDISAEKSLADQREGLVRELDHRVKNVLAAVQSLAAQSARRTVSLEAFLKTFFGRVEAMAAAHTLLTSTRWRGVDIGHVAAAELGGLAQGQARWEGPELILNARATHALTLALHELGANAMRYGALSTETGRVEIKWSLRPGGGFRLTWTEKNGPSVSPPTHRGFGSTLLERVTGKELGGEATLDFRPEGLRAVVTADSSALAAAEPWLSAAIPVVGEQASAPPDPPAGASRGGLGEADITGVRVLIVEDAVLLALELESGLTESGALVVGSAADIVEATRMLDLTFDVAVLDANLNGKSAIPVAEALVARGIPFIFATGYGDAGGAPTGFTAPIVRKPYNIRQIAAALASAMEG